MGFNPHQLEDPNLADFYGILRTYWAEAENNPPSGHSTLVDSDGYDAGVDTPDGETSVGTTDIDDDPPSPLVPTEVVGGEQSVVIEVDSQPTESEAWTDCQPSAHDPYPAAEGDSMLVSTEPEALPTETTESREMKGDGAVLVKETVREAEVDSMPPPPVPVKPKGQRLMLGGVTFSLPSKPPPGIKDKCIQLVAAKVAQLKKLSYTSYFNILCTQVSMSFPVYLSIIK